VKTVDLGQRATSLADVLMLAKSEPVVIHSGPGETIFSNPPTTSIERRRR